LRGDFRLEKVSGGEVLARGWVLGNFSGWISGKWEEINKKGLSLIDGRRKGREREKKGLSMIW